MKIFPTVDWAHSTNIYEVNIRQYSYEGTFNAFANSLPRLKDMGVETLWLMPVQPIGKLKRKGTLGSYYSISDYTAVNPEFGTEEDLRHLINKAHSLGFKLIIDWVANHTSWDHVWTQTNPGFFSKDEHGGFRSPYPEWEDVIHLNYDNHDLWRSMINDMAYWVKEFDVDGFRCDMAHLVRLEFWEEARRQLDAIKPLFWLAETEDIIYHRVFDASYTWEWMHKTEDYFKGHCNIENLFQQLVRYNTDFPAEAIRMYFTSNHDENSHTGTEMDKFGEAYKALGVFGCTWNGIPMLYSGQEIPNTKRLQFFDKDPIDWGQDCSLHFFYQQLLRLHSSHPALKAADDEVSTFKLYSDGEEVFSFLRKRGDRHVVIALNLSSTPRDISIYSDHINGSYQELFTTNVMSLSAQFNLSLAPFGFKVYYK